MKKYYLSALGSFTIFAACAQNPVFQWARTMGGTGYDNATAVTTDALGNVYTTGSFHNSVDFDPGPGTTTLTSNGVSDIYVTKFDFAGNFVWAKQIGGSSYDDPTSIAIDAAANIHITGAFGGTVDFDPGAGTATIVAPNTSVFIAKLDASGNYVWAKHFAGSAGVYGAGEGIAVDAAGNVYTTGFFENTFDFDPGAGSYPLVSAAPGYGDIFISKLDVNGNFTWAKRIGDVSPEQAKSIVLDRTGSLYIGGYFSGTVDFDPGAGVTNLASIGAFANDGFVLKIDTSGTFAWAKQISGSTETIYDVDVDTLGNVYSLGNFMGTIDCNPDTGLFNLTSAGLSDFFITKFTSAGDFSWAIRIGGPNDDVGGGLDVDDSGNVYATGNFEGTVDFDPGAGTANLVSSILDIFVFKIDSAANYKWAAALTGPGYDGGMDIIAEPNGNVYVVGSFGSTVDFDPGAGNTSYTSSGSNDFFILKLSNSVITTDGFVSASPQYTCYPNPATDVLFVKGNYTSYKIVDCLGQQVSSGTAASSIDVSAYAAGVYFLIIDTPTGSSAQRFIKN